MKKFKDVFSNNKPSSSALVERPESLEMPSLPPILEPPPEPVLPFLDPNITWPPMSFSFQHKTPTMELKIDLALPFMPFLVVPLSSIGENKGPCNTMQTPTL